MELYRFIQQAQPSAARHIATMAVVAGLSSTAMLALVNAATQASARQGGSSFHRLLLFLIAFAVFYLSNRAALVAASEVVEQGLRQLRLRLMQRVRQADLMTLDRLDSGELFVTLAERTGHLSELFPALGAAAQQVLLVAFCAIYLLYLSPLASSLILAVTGLLAWLFWRQRRLHHALLRQEAQKQAELLDCLDHFVDGFQEVRTNCRRSDGLQEHFRQLAGEAESTVVALARTWSLALMATNLYLFSLLALLAYALPMLSDRFDSLVIELTAVVLFAFGPLTMIMTLLPLFEQANGDLEALASLESRLHAGEEPSSPLDAPLPPLRELRCRELAFSYRDEEGNSTFTSGPWNLEIRPGEILFLTGGNGSGKSTFLKLLTGLYPPDVGHLEVNGTPIQTSNLAELRERFCCIFADFHLFDRLYGLEQVEPERVRALLERVELRDKVDFLDGRFTTLKLSTGQRKRLALVVALLADREIYVFDEWAADQDTRFREQFYLQILPQLRARGKAVIVVSHDDRYWKTGDRLLQLEHGLPAQERPVRETP